MKIMTMTVYTRSSLKIHHASSPEKIKPIVDTASALSPCWFKVKTVKIVQGSEIQVFSF